MMMAAERSREGLEGYGVNVLVKAGNWFQRSGTLWCRYLAMLKYSLWKDYGECSTNDFKGSRMGLEGFGTNS